jgi:hypothetical protein
MSSAPVASKSGHDRRASTCAVPSDPLYGTLVRRYGYMRGHRDMSTSTDHEHHDPSEHDHVHGEGCGHETVQHGDHLDYLHDGHRHAEHAGHFDEHDDNS